MTRYLRFLGLINAVGQIFSFCATSTDNIFIVSGISFLYLIFVVWIVRTVRSQAFRREVLPSAKKLKANFLSLKRNTLTIFCAKYQYPLTR